MRQGERIIIEDVQIDPGFEPHRHIAASAGFRAVQSTPLFTRGGELLGMLSTHFRKPHRPQERDLRLTDLYARQATELIERKQADEALRVSEERFRHMVEGVKDYAIHMVDLDGGGSHYLNTVLAHDGLFQPGNPGTAFLTSL